MVPPATLRWLATLPLTFLAALPRTQVRGWAADINDPRLAEARRSVEREMVSERAGYSERMQSGAGVPSPLLALVAEARRHCLAGGAGGRKWWQPGGQSVMIPMQGRAAQSVGNTAMQIAAGQPSLIASKLASEQLLLLLSSACQFLPWPCRSGSRVWRRS